VAARKSAIEIDFGVFEDLADQLEKLGADLKTTFSEVMEEEGKKVAQDTVEAVQNVNLPAGGRYSSSAKETANSIIMNPKVEWSGSEASIGLGFDKTKPGAGGFLITGTPKMRPDYALEKIYGQKKYERDMKKHMIEGLQDQIHKRLGRFE
jgi:hypothetical protein